MAYRLLAIDQVVERAKRCKASIYNDIKAGTFPAPVKVGPRSSRWRETEVDEWIEQLPTADFANTTAK